MEYDEIKTKNWHNQQRKDYNITGREGRKEGELNFVSLSIENIKIYSLVKKSFKYHISII
jgi:hypothetical protein